MARTLTPRQEADANIDRMLLLADQLDDAAKTLSRIRTAPPAFDALWDDKVYPLDALEFGVAIRLAAEDWEAALDEAESEAAEAEDRRRANPLEPDYRRFP